MIREDPEPLLSVSTRMGCGRLITKLMIKSIGYPAIPAARVQVLHKPHQGCLYVRNL